MVEGEIFQKDLARLRAFMASPMQHGRLFLAGDAVPIVPPTGAKGLNLAAGDARALVAGLATAYRGNDQEPLRSYSDICLHRAWRTAQTFW